MTPAFQQIGDYLAGRYTLREYPSLSAQMERFGAERPFAGRALLDCTPIFANTLLKHQALLIGGAELTVGATHVGFTGIAGKVTLKLPRMSDGEMCSTEPSPRVMT